MRLRSGLWTIALAHGTPLPRGGPRGLALAHSIFAYYSVKHEISCSALKLDEC